MLATLTVASKETKAVPGGLVQQVSVASPGVCTAVQHAQDVLRPLLHGMSQNRAFQQLLCCCKVCHTALPETAGLLGVLSHLALAPLAPPHPLVLGVEGMT
jgi:hypothetical protein